MTFSSATAISFKFFSRLIEAITNKWCLEKFLWRSSKISNIIISFLIYIMKQYKKLFLLRISTLHFSNEIRLLTWQKHYSINSLKSNNENCCERWKRAQRHHINYNHKITGSAIMYLVLFCSTIIKCLNDAQCIKAQ